MFSFINSKLALSKDMIRLLNNLSVEYTSVLDFSNLANVRVLLNLKQNGNIEEPLARIETFFQDLIAKNAATATAVAVDDAKVEADVPPPICLDLFCKLCTLYFYGGCILNANIRITNYALIETIEQLTVVKSCVNDGIFDGFMIAKKGDPLLLELINQYLDNPSETNLASLLVCKAPKVLQENIVGNVSTIFYNSLVDDASVPTPVAEHYFKITTLLEAFKLTKQTQSRNLKKLKIGVTISVPPTLKDFYSNGIKQNCLYLYELLKNMDYDVKLIIDELKNQEVIKNIGFYTFDYCVINDVFAQDFDLIFSMGFSIPVHILTSLKNAGTKIVYYMCGNNYLIDAERILYDQHKHRTVNYANDQYYEQVWMIPQMYNQNKWYCEILQNTQCIQVPFIWSSMSIQFVSKILNLDSEESLLYKKKEGKIGIFEPNISVMKWSLPCVLIAEQTHRTYHNVSHVYVTNMNKPKDCTTSDINHFNMEQFNNACKGLSLAKDRKLSVESRFVTLDFMSKHCDVAVSHQWENPLNYLYLDLAWMGWPILHNAALCKDVGYYYEGFNYGEAAEKLNHILTNHEQSAKAYLEANRRTIDVYLPSNVELQRKYRGLIEGLFVK